MSRFLDYAATLAFLLVVGLIVLVAWPFLLRRPA
jgi:hypothetical protein